MRRLSAGAVGILALALAAAPARAQDIPTPSASCVDAFCNCNGRQVEVPGGCSNQNADCRCVCGYSSCPQGGSGGGDSSGASGMMGGGQAGNPAAAGAMANSLGAALGAALVAPPPPLPQYHPPKVNVPQNLDDNPAADATINSGVGAAQDIINGYDSAPPPQARPPSGGDVPMLLRGDPMKDCQGRNLIYNPECADLSLDTPALQRNSAENQKALADGAAFERDIDADAQAQESADSMQDRLKDYLKDKVLDKAEDKLDDLGREAGLPVDAIERVKEGGGILKNYATKTLDNFDHEATNAACALGSGSSACMDAYHDAEAKQGENTRDFDHDTYNFVGKQFGAKPEGGEGDDGGD